MAEFCLDCWNKINGTDDCERKYILSKHLDFCEECGEWKHVIIMERKAYYMHVFSIFAIPIRIIYSIIYFIWKLMILAYLIFEHNKSKKKQC